MKNTYLMEPEEIKKRLDFLWKRYQEILDRPNWENLNEARAILFLTGRIYCEQIAVGAIEKRLKHLDSPLELVEFLQLIDSDSDKLEEYRKDPKFVKLEKFYKIIKDYKNKVVGGKMYKDEERFVELYNKYAPDEQSKTAYKGIVKLKNEKDNS